MALTDTGYPKTFLGMVKVSLEKGILSIPYDYIAISQYSPLIYPGTGNAEYTPPGMALPYSPLIQGIPAMIYRLLPWMAVPQYKVSRQSRDLLSTHLDGSAP